LSGSYLIFVFVVQYAEAMFSANDPDYCAPPTIISIEPTMNCVAGSDGFGAFAHPFTAALVMFESNNATAIKDGTFAMASYGRSA
jgi:hypothetical protein